MWAVSLQSVAGRLATPLGHIKKKAVEVLIATSKDITWYTMVQRATHVTDLVSEEYTPQMYHYVFLPPSGFALVTGTHMIIIIIIL